MSPPHVSTLAPRRVRRVPVAAGWLVSLAALATLPTGVRAQATGEVAPVAASECYGFAFGRWSPPLDLGAAGHGPPPAGGVGPTAPGGRDWASPDAAGAATTLLLFPAWWPAGVQVRLPVAPHALGDTVRGVATALVADGRVRPPTTAVRAWGVRCTGGGAARAPRPGARRPPERSP